MKTKNTFRITYPGVSILTRLLFATGLFIITLFTSGKALAACLPNNSGGACTTDPNLFSCNISIPPSTVQTLWCCVNSTECDAQKQTMKEIVEENTSGALAGCSKMTGSSCKAFEQPCSKPSSPGVVVCCPGTKECKQYQAGKGAPGGYQAIDLCDFAGDKNADCMACKGTNGIWTALGCIPFEQDGFVIALIKIIMGIAGFIAFAMMIVGTIIMMTGGSNPEQMKKGKEIFTGAIVGLLFLIFSVIALQIITKDIVKLDIGITQKINIDLTKPLS